jgi:hypothetical protein
MARIRGRIVTGYAQMWTRTVFDLREKGGLLPEAKETLNLPGVYVLYRDDEPHYIGKTSRPLFDRIYEHANIAKDKRFNFWNFFSAFEVPKSRDRDEIEAVLIAAMPTANSANPKIHPIPIPRKVGDVLAKRREIDVAHPRLSTAK